MCDPSKRYLLILALFALLMAMMPVQIIPGEDGWEPESVITWSPGDGPIVIDESIEIDETTRLVIEAGVEVRLDEGKGIQVKGHLLVQGTAQEPVLFTANDTSVPLGPDSWESIRLLSESAGRTHLVEHAMFQGARTGLLVSSTEALVQDCTFTLNRYGLVARGGAMVEVRSSDFINNSALGLEWEEGSGGLAVDCYFEDNVVGVYFYRSSTPQVVNCEFSANYHHASFANGSDGTIRSCTFRGAIAEAYECYDASSPLLVDVTIENQDDDGIHIRNDSRPRMVGGTPVSNMVVDSKDNGSYVIAMAWITVEVRGDDGKRLEEANVTVRGASGSLFTRGMTDGEGVLMNVLMSTYTVGLQGGHDLENPHTVVVEWRGHNQTFRVDPRDLNNDWVLVLEMDIDPPEPGGWGFVNKVVLIMLISVTAIVVAWWVLRKK